MNSIASVPVNVGPDIAFFRSQAGITQSHLATKAGVDQSRISRLEKGEAATTTEVSRVISALAALGSTKIFLD